VPPYNNKDAQQIWQHIALRDRPTFDRINNTTPSILRDVSGAWDVGFFFVEEAKWLSQLSRW